MEQKQSIEQLVHNVRNKLQAFWTLTDMIIVPIEGDIVVSAELAKAQGDSIISMLETIVQIAEEKRYTEQDMKQCWYSAIKNNKEMNHVFGSWIESYNETKQ